MDHEWTTRLDASLRGFVSSALESKRAASLIHLAALRKRHVAPV
jgi:hypothetical protein